jgi:hypothetical protein
MAFFIHSYFGSARLRVINIPTVSPQVAKKENVNKVCKFTKEERRSVISEADARLGLSFGTGGTTKTFGDFCEVCPSVVQRREEAAVISDRHKTRLCFRSIA